jgi:hypothetical protein
MNLARVDMEELAALICELEAFFDAGQVLADIGMVPEFDLRSPGPWVITVKNQCAASMDFHSDDAPTRAKVAEVAPEAGVPPFEPPAVIEPLPEPAPYRRYSTAPEPFDPAVQAMLDRLEEPLPPPDPAPEVEPPAPEPPEPPPLKPFREETEAVTLVAVSPSTMALLTGEEQPDAPVEAPHQWSNGERAGQMWEPHEDDAIIKGVSGGVPWRDMADSLGRTEASLRTRAATVLKARVAAAKAKASDGDLALEHRSNGAEIIAALERSNRSASSLAGIAARYRVPYATLTAFVERERAT